jgi:hypothetical protein
MKLPSSLKSTGGYFIVCEFENDLALSIHLKELKMTKKKQRSQEQFIQMLKEMHPNSTPVVGKSLSIQEVIQKTKIMIEEKDFNEQDQ